MPTLQLQCIDCPNTFEHTERDQDFYAERGFETPKRCKPCRIKKKNRRNDGGGHGGYGNDREQFGL